MPWWTCLYFPSRCVSSDLFYELLLYHPSKLIFAISSTFLPGAYFDLRVELHAYDKDNSTVPEPYTSFKTLVRKDGKGKWQNADDFFGFEQTPALENWNFTWANTIEATLKEESGVDVAVTSRIWRKIKFDEPGTYDVAVQYGPKDYYTVRYNVVQVMAK